MIVNAILHEHQIVVDIIAFVNKGDFPRSRLGEKQRGTVLAKWVKRSLQTEAQFAIRNSDFSPDGGPQGGEEAQHRASLGSLRGAAQGAGGSSLRNVESVEAPRERYSAASPQVGPGDQGFADGNFGGEGNYPAEVPGEQTFLGEVYSGHGSLTGDRRPSAQGANIQEHLGQRAELAADHGEPGERTSMYGKLPGVDGREQWGEGEAEEDDWRADAVMHMNLAEGMGRAT